MTKARISSGPFVLDAHLMTKGDELKFQGGTTSNAEEEQENEDKNRHHADDGMAPT